jgi:hypothetical protein
MHFNRMMGPDVEVERLTIALLHRTIAASVHGRMPVDP